MGKQSQPKLKIFAVAEFCKNLNCFAEVDGDKGIVVVYDCDDGEKITESIYSWKENMYE